MLKIEKIPVSQIDAAQKESLSFWANCALISLFAQKDHINAYYLIVSKKQTIKAIMPIFEKKKWGFTYIYQPRLYKYTPIDFFTDSTSQFHTQNEQLEILSSIAQYLRKTYTISNITLYHNLTDIRAFKASGFEIDTLYTYLKKIDTYSMDPLPRILKRQLATASKNGVNCKQSWDIPAFTLLSKSFKGRKGELDMAFDDNLFSFLDKLYQNDLCTSVIAYKDDTPLAYRILLIDTSKHYLVDMLAVAGETGNNYGAGVACLDYIFRHFCEYETFDFCGANIPNIAFFKSQFLCELVPYFGVKRFTIS